MTGLIAGILPAPARAQGLPLIRDTEIESLLNDYAQTIFKAAGFGGGRVSVRIVNNGSFNAFVVDGRNVYMHTGALMQAERRTRSSAFSPTNPATSPAAIWRRCGRASPRIRRARSSSNSRHRRDDRRRGRGRRLRQGDRQRRPRRDDGRQRDSSCAAFSRERRSQESAADQAGLKYLDATQQSGRGMLATFERFAGQELFSDAQKDPFARTHPVATDRLRGCASSSKSSPYFGSQGSAGAAAPPRHDARQALRLHRARRAPSSTAIRCRTRAFPRATRARSPRSVRAARAVSRRRSPRPTPHPRAARQSLFLGAQGRLPAEGRPPAEASRVLRKALQLSPAMRRSSASSWRRSCCRSKSPGGADEAIALLRKAIVRESRQRHRLQYAGPSLLR